ncbi:hypothetical protein [Deinococcus sp. YIM 77859]|uniref:hypothetical protein n=1 Tax=Deinococcus sp. YIM 77859 TaxID=1540221 RepID=UPI000AFD6895|nr:hypothetical protein [Deinococcus sp. YIM 77859]
MIFLSLRLPGEPGGLPSSGAQAYPGVYHLCSGGAQGQVRESGAKSHDRSPASLYSPS